MSAQLNEDERDERSLVKMYMDLTGTTEPCALSVFMFASEPDPEALPTLDHPVEPASRPKAPSASRLGLVLVAALGLCSAAEPARSAQFDALQAFTTQPLSLAAAVNLALQQNPSILRAKKDLEASQGVVIQTRAIALPKLAVTGNFSAVEPTDIDQVSIPSLGPRFSGLTLGNDKNWSSQVKLVQSLYEGGRILSAVRAARLTKEQSLLNYQTTVADTVLAVQLAYLDILLAEQQITVQEASVALLARELADTKRRFDAGTVPRFNVLRAEVELANARPRLIRARNGFHIAKNNLANLLGFTVPQGTPADIPLLLSGKLEAEPYQLDLQAGISLALRQRTELGALRKAQALRSEDVINAKAGYKPSLQAFAGYDTHNSTLHSDISYEDHGWLTGVQMTWNLFDGLRTQGRVKETTAQYEKAGVEIDDAGRRIELEVRTAHSSFIEAQDVLESQKKVVEEAEEALRLARSRYEAGTGTQLDVLSAQTALTEARTTQIQALHDYAVARARLERAVGATVPTTAAQP